PSFDATQQGSHDALGRSPLHPPRLAVVERGPIRVQERRAQGPRVAIAYLERVGRQIETGGESGEIPTGRRQVRFVEIVEIEVAEAIVALVAAEVLQVQIAREPGERRGV